MGKIDIEIQDNFQSSLNLHDAHVLTWVRQLDALHPRALLERVRQAELESFDNAWDYWQEVDKPKLANPASALEVTASNCPAHQTEPVPTTPTPESEVAGGLAPLTRNEIAICFADLRGWDVERWRKHLSSPDAWLSACRASKGTRGRGGAESTWWPVDIALSLVNLGFSTTNLLHARFKSMKSLQPWREAFENNFPEGD